MPPTKSELTLTSSPMHLLHRAEQCVTAAFEQEMRTLQLPLTSRQLVVMMALDRDGGVSQTALVEVTGIDRSTLSDIMARLVRQGVARRRRDRDDRRAYAVTLTKTGKEMLEQARPVLEGIEERLLAALSTASQRGFVGMLDTIVRRLSAPQPPSSHQART